jgi:hypothetical protein
MYEFSSLMLRLSIDNVSRCALCGIVNLDLADIHIIDSFLSQFGRPSDLHQPIQRPVDFFYGCHLQNSTALSVVQWRAIQ